MAKKYTKIGAVLNMGKGPFVVLGNEKEKNEAYRYNVEVRVTNLKGEKVAYSKNGTLSLFDPRKRKGITEEQAAKVPAVVQWELVLTEEK